MPDQQGRRYSYAHVYRRRSRPGRWLHRRAQTVVAVTAIAEVLGYVGVTALISDRWFPSPAAAWSLGVVGLALVGGLFAVMVWARRD